MLSKALDPPVEKRTWKSTQCLLCAGTVLDILQSLSHLVLRRPLRRKNCCFSPHRRDNQVSVQWFAHNYTVKTKLAFTSCSFHLPLPCFRGVSHSWLCTRNISIKLSFSGPTQTYWSQSLETGPEVSIANVPPGKSNQSHWKLQFQIPFFSGCLYHQRSEIEKKTVERADLKPVTIRGPPILCNEEACCDARIGKQLLQRAG